MLSGRIFEEDPFFAWVQEILRITTEGLWGLKMEPKQSRWWLLWWPISCQCLSYDLVPSSEKSKIVESEQTDKDRINSTIDSSTVVSYALAHCRPTTVQKKYQHWPLNLKSVWERLTESWKPPVLVLLVLYVGFAVSFSCLPGFSTILETAKTRHSYQYWSVWREHNNHQHCSTYQGCVLKKREKIPLPLLLVLLLVIVHLQERRMQLPPPSRSL